MAWAKGQTGNPLGGALRKPFKTAMVMELLKEGKDKDGFDMPRLRRIADAICTKAEDGDVQAARFIAEWFDGKPTQIIEASINDSRDISSLSPDEVDRRIEELAKRRQRYLSITARASAEDVK